jgi:hypothetical protein
MPIQIDDLEVMSLPSTEPTPTTPTQAAPPDLAEQLRTWQKAATTRHDRLRAD